MNKNKKQSKERKWIRIHFLLTLSILMILWVLDTRSTFKEAVEDQSRYLRSQFLSYFHPETDLEEVVVQDLLPKLNGDAAWQANIFDSIYFYHYYLMDADGNLVGDNQSSTILDIYTDSLEEEQIKKHTPPLQRLGVDLRQYLSVDDLNKVIEISTEGSPLDIVRIDYHMNGNGTIVPVKVIFTNRRDPQVELTLSNETVTDTMFDRLVLQQETVNMSIEEGVIGHLGYIYSDIDLMQTKKIQKLLEKNRSIRLSKKSKSFMEILGPSMWGFHSDWKWNEGYTAESFSILDSEYWLMGVWQVNFPKLMLEKRYFLRCLLAVVLVGLVTKSSLKRADRQSAKMKSRRKKTSPE